MMKNTEEVLPTDTASNQEATPAGPEIQPPIAGPQEDPPAALPLNDNQMAEDSPLEDVVCQPENFTVPGVLLNAPPAALPLNDNQVAEDSPLEDVVCQPENFAVPGVLPNVPAVQCDQHNPVLGCQPDMDVIAVERVEYEAELSESDPQCSREQQHPVVVEYVRPTGFKKYKQLWWERMKKSPITYFLVLMIDIACAVLAPILPEISDIIYCVLIVSFTCAVSTIVLERASCNKKVGKIVEGCIESKSCCGNFRTEVHLQSQYMHPTSADDMQFQHEVADPESGNPNEPSRVFHANFESLESRSTDNTPDSPKTIDVDIHGTVRTPSHAEERSSSSSQQGIDERVVFENKPGTSKQSE